MRGKRHAAVLFGCVALMGGLVGACGEDDDSGGGGSGGGTTTEGATGDAKVIDTAAMEGAKGNVTFCQGKDTAGNAKALIEEFNDQVRGPGSHREARRVPG